VFDRTTGYSYADHLWVERLRLDAGMVEWYHSRLGGYTLTDTGYEVLTGDSKRGTELEPERDSSGSNFDPPVGHESQQFVAIYERRIDCIPDVRSENRCVPDVRSGCECFVTEHERLDGSGQ
jgi:hypothetical protein